jgi:hypothetical protein
MMFHWPEVTDHCILHPTGKKWETDINLFGATLSFVAEYAFNSILQRKKAG